jgi:hypothetical protein
MEKLEKEYENVRTKVENGKSFVHCEDGVAIARTSNRKRPTPGSSHAVTGDFVASKNIYEKEPILWIKDHNEHPGGNGRTLIGCQMRGGVTFLLGWCRGARF